MTGKWKIITLTLIIMLAISGGIFSLSSVTHAETADELRQKIADQNDEVSKLEQEIAQYTSQLNSVSATANTLAGQIKEIDLTRKKLLTDIKLTEKKISSKNLSIKGLELQIGDKNQSIQESTGALSEGIKNIDEKDTTNLIAALLSPENLAEGWTRVDQILLFQQQIRTHINDLSVARTGLETNRDKEKKAKAELITLQSELNDQKKIADDNAKQKASLLKDTKNQQSNYASILAPKKARKDALEKEIDDYESKLKFILDPNSLPSGVALGWPLDSVYITQRFGVTSSSGRLYASGSHNGVDFRAPIGTPVMAMNDGIVLGVGDSDLTCKGASFGKWVLIKYDNGLSSTYGHFSLIKAHEGQRVSRGEVVGYSGNTGYSTGPHLHVSVYASGSVAVAEKASKTCNGRIYRLPFAAINGYLDPLKYMPALSGNVPK
jgi:murein DD-endopeptidase MepM/ murein hydrolase activator NlpD